MLDGQQTAFLALGLGIHAGLVVGIIGMGISYLVERRRMRKGREFLTRADAAIRRAREAGHLVPGGIIWIAD